MGPYEEDRFDNGFFDYKRVYCDVNLSDDNHTISYIGDMLGGNYQEIFGNWLPSIWEPMAISHDDDQNPETDGVLKAFLGVAPEETERTWWKNTTDTTDPKKTCIHMVKSNRARFNRLVCDWYNAGAVEDVLNLVGNNSPTLWVDSLSTLSDNLS